MSKIDILFIPIAGKFVNIKNTVSLINELEPPIVIPFHYDAGEKKNKELDDFLNEFAKESVEKLDKLTIKKKDINPEKTKIIVLESNL